MEEDFREPYPDINRTSSFTECTGLMFRPPLDEDEYESYQDVYGMGIPRIE